MPDTFRLVPHSLRADVVAYVERGKLDSEFLRAVIENNPRAADRFGTDEQRDAIRSLVAFFAITAPPACWGSPAICRDWMAVGGLRGLKAGVAG